MAKRNNRYTMTLRMPAHLADAMRRLAEIDHRDLTAEIVVAIEEFLKRRSEDLPEELRLPERPG